MQQPGENSPYDHLILMCGFLVVLPIPISLDSGETVDTFVIFGRPVIMRPCV